jgi:catechol 2,3-dioxygenase-like lactoylglutathione lyase family enzyme
MSSPVTHPNSVMLSCKDCKQSVAFYRDVLGFELKEAWPDADKPAWANLVLDGQSIMLGQNPTDEEADACGHGPPDRLAFWREQGKAFNALSASGGSPGLGAAFYIAVPDVDAFHETLKGRGCTPLLEPVTQFYGIRDIVVEDPSGYHLVIYSQAQMTQCGSCGMPLTDAKEGQMYCEHCTDDSGHLHPYEAILEGTIQGYFMGMQGMERAQAELAAREHLAKMPAWSMRE